jgi:hypothetical protein
LFSLAGGIIWFVLYQVGILAAISGLIGVVCAIKGYAIFGKRESTKGIIISTVIAFIVLVLAWYLCLSYDVYDAYQLCTKKAMSISPSHSLSPLPTRTCSWKSRRSLPHISRIWVWACCSASSAHSATSRPPSAKQSAANSFLAEKFTQKRPFTRTVFLY